MDQLFEFIGRHALLAGGFVAVLGVLAWSELARRNRGYRELSPAEAVPMINGGQTVIVDISPKADFDKGHIVGAKCYLPSRFNQPDKEIEKLRDKSVLVVCRNGQTALGTAAALVKLGAAEVAVLKGGMTQWRSDNYPVTRD